MHTLAMFLGEEGLGTVLEQTPAPHFRNGSGGNLALHLQDLAAQLAAVDSHVKALLAAVGPAKLH